MFCGDCCYWNNNNSTEFNELFQISQPFSLPHSLPQWPQGEGFATGRIRLGELEVAKITKFECVWNCQPSRRNVKGQIGYALVSIIAMGVMLGADQPVILHMLDIPLGVEALNRVKMELADAAFSLLKGVVATTDVAKACKGVNVAVMVGGFPRKEGMKRKDVMAKNISIYKSQASTLEQHAAPNCKVLVVDNPANTNALILKEFAPSIPEKNITCLTRLDHNRALGQISERLNVQVSDVKNVII